MLHPELADSHSQREALFDVLLVASQLLKAGAQVHHVSKDGRSTALHEAVLRNHADLTDLLLRASANPFLENAAGEPSATVQPL